MDKVTDSTTGRPVITALSSPGKAEGASSINVDDPTNWTEDTAIHFTIYKTITVAGISVKDTTTQTDWKGTLSGNTISNLTLTGGDDREYVAGDIVELTPTARWAKDLYELLSQIVDQEGALIPEAVRTALNLGSGDLSGWNPLGYTVNSITNNGNGSYDLLFNGQDLTGVISEGMRIKTVRSVAAPNTSFSLDGVNDYYVKTSPNKMSWTDDFAAGFWVYLTTYQDGVIASRYNGTSGWQFRVNASGQVQMLGYNAGSSNVSYVQSYQSVPLNKWTFVAAQLDMSAFTATTTTSYVMINGVDVPATVTRAGTNPTSLIQAGNFEIGSHNGGSFPFPGYIGDGGVFSAKVTQATMRSYMSQPLTGSETNLASGYKNGSTSDLNTTTPNDLTATNGATTASSSPYGNRGASTTIDFGVVMAKTFATNTTLTVQVPEGCTIPTSGGLASISYSSENTPYGFVRDRGRWTISTLLFNTYSKSVGSTTAWYVTPVKLLVPVGAWKLGYSAQARVGGNTGATAVNGHLSLTSQSSDYTTSTVPQEELRRNSWLYSYATGATQIQVAGSLYNMTEQQLSAQRTYSLSGNTSEAAGAFIFELYSGTEIFAENAYI